MADIAHEEWLLIKISTLIKDTGDITDITMVNEDLAYALEGPIQTYVNLQLLPPEIILVTGNLIV